MNEWKELKKLSEKKHKSIPEVMEEILNEEENENDNSVREQQQG
jgi:hypothetical protein